MFGQKRIPSREGGVEIVVEELCTRMVAQGHNVTCYNRGGHHVSGSEYDSKRLKEYKGIKLKTVPTIEKKGLAAVSSSFFAALCCAFGKYDVVHIHAEGPAFFTWLPKLFSKKVIVTIHGLDWQREKWKSGFGAKFIHHGEKNAVKYADEIVVLSKGVQDYFKKEYGRETVFIPNGVNRPKIQEAELITKKYSLEKDSYILFLGRLVPEKGIRYLVEAFKNVKTDKKLKLLFTFDIVVLFVIYFYSWQIRRTVLTYKNACGMWWADKVKPYVSVITNLVLNFSLVQVCGIYGVMLSTIVCYIFIEAPWETHALFKEYFKQRTSKYWKNELMYTLLTIILMVMTFGVCECIKINGIHTFFGVFFKDIINMLNLNFNFIIIMIGALFTVLGPCLLYSIVKKIWIFDFLFYPAKYIQFKK